MLQISQNTICSETIQEVYHNKDVKILFHAMVTQKPVPSIP